MLYGDIKHFCVGLQRTWKRIQPCSVDGSGEGNVSSGQRGSGEEGHSGSGTVLDNWPVRVHYKGVIWPHQKNS